MNKPNPTRRVHAPFAVVATGKDRRRRQLKIKRFFALDDPQVPELRELCLQLMGKTGWSMRKATSSNKVKSLRYCLSVQKVFTLPEEARAAGEAIVKALRPRPRPQGHAASRQWCITSPGGQQYIVTNLLHWCRENSALFEPFDTVGQLVQSGLQLADRVYASLRDPRQRFWKYWTAAKLGGKRTRQQWQSRLLEAAQALRVFHEGKHFACFATPDAAGQVLRVDVRMFQPEPPPPDPIPFPEIDHEQ